MDGQVSQVPSPPVKYVEPLFSSRTSRMLEARAPVPKIKFYLHKSIQRKMKGEVQDHLKTVKATKTPTGCYAVSKRPNNFNILRSQLVHCSISIPNMR